MLKKKKKRKERKKKKKKEKEKKIYAGRPTTVFCVHILYMNYVTKTFLLVNSSVTSEQPSSFVHGYTQKMEQKTYNKERCWSHNLPPLLTVPMIRPWRSYHYFFSFLSFFFCGCPISVTNKIA